MINNKTLLNAAKIIAKTGEQLESIIAILEEQLSEKLSNDKEAIETIYFNAGEEYSCGRWFLQSYLFNLSIKKSKNKKPFGFVAIKIVLYNEKEIEVPGWEPSIYVMYQRNQGPFEIDSFLLSNILEEGCELDGRILWRWNEEGWGFVLPLVKLNSEKDLYRQIIEPVKKLLNKIDVVNAFPIDCIAFLFEVDEDSISIKELLNP